MASKKRRKLNPLELSWDSSLYEESQCAQRFLLLAFFLAISFAYFCAAFDYKMAALSWPLDAVS